MLTQVALYAHNHTSIDPHDVVAFYAAMATPNNFPYKILEKSPKATKEIFDQVCSTVISDLLIKDPEEIEGAYNVALQAAFDDNPQGCGTSSLFGYIADMRSALNL